MILIFLRHGSSGPSLKHTNDHGSVWFGLGYLLWRIQSWLRLQSYWNDWIEFAAISALLQLRGKDHLFTQSLRYLHEQE
jgi:hypothetical protein